MNDYWNDPPESPEPPECSECKMGFGDHIADVETGMLMECDNCRNRWIVKFPPYYGITQEDIDFMKGDI